jgi:hypothetical protein
MTNKTLTKRRARAELAAAALTVAGVIAIAVAWVQQGVNFGTP